MKFTKANFRRFSGSNTDLLPIYDPNSFSAKRISRLKSEQKNLIHLIPLTVLACLFILWCLPCSANVEITDGRVTVVHQMEMLKSPPVTERLIDHTVLAAITTHTPSIPLMTQTPHNIHTENAQTQPANDTATTPNASIPLMIKVPKNIHTENASAQPANETGTLIPSSLIFLDIVFPE